MNDWHITYEGATGIKLRDDIVDEMNKLINRKIDNTDDYEISDAVEELCEETRTGKRKYKISANNIISKIIEIRYRKKAPAINPQTKTEQILNERKNKIIHAESDEEKWEIICSDELEVDTYYDEGKEKREKIRKCDDVINDFCHPLLDFTIKRFPGFRVPDYAGSVKTL